MTAPRIEITSDGFKTELTINGQKVQGIRKLTFESEFGEPAILKLELIAASAGVENVRTTDH